MVKLRSVLARFRRVTGEGAFVLLGQLGAVLGTMVGVKYLTRSLDVETFGHLSLLLTIVSFANLLCYGPLCNAAERFWSIAGEQHDSPALLGSLRHLAYVSALAITFLAVIAALILTRIAEGYFAMATLLAASLAVAGGCSALITSVQNGARHRKVVAFHQAFDGTLRPTFAVILLTVFDKTLVCALLGFLGAAVVVLVSNALVLARSIHDSFACVTVAWRQRILTYSWPITLWGGFAWAQQTGGKWALASFGSPEDVAHFAILLQFGATPMILLGSVLSQFASPVIFQRVGAGTDPARTRASLRMVYCAAAINAAVTLCATFVASAVHAPVLSFFVSGEFEVPTQLLPLLVLSGGIFSSAQIISLHELALNRTSTLAAVKVMTSICSVTFSLMGVTRLGLLGAVLADLAFSLLYLVAMIALSLYSSQILRSRLSP